MSKEIVHAIPCPDFLLTGRCNLRCKYCFEHNHSNEDMNNDLLMKYISKNDFISSFPLGGEPLLVLDKLIEAIKIIENNDLMGSKRKKSIIKTFKSVITNGILVPQMADKLKEHGFVLQISIDGCKEVNDMNRVFPTGKGTYDHIIKAIECCVENEIEWSIHGVITKETLPYLFETTKWFFDMYVKYKPDGLDFAVDYLKYNTFQIVFEDDYQNSDVDIIIDQFFKIAEWVWNHEEMTDDQKERFFDNFFFKTGGVCGAGTGLLAFDAVFNIFPCHRVAFTDDRDKYLLGNVFDIEGFKNFKLYNAFHKIGKRKRYMYSAVTQNHNYNNEYSLMWSMWCPATNLQESGNLFLQPVKYNLMLAELNRAIKIIRLSYFGSMVPKTTLEERKKYKC